MTQQLELDINRPAWHSANYKYEPQVRKPINAESNVEKSTQGWVKIAAEQFDSKRSQDND